jgi:CRP-like cAMP-binding protein
MDRIKTKIAYLSENELFHGIPRQELKEIECRLAMTTCEKGRVFFMPSETPDVLFVLKEGRVQLYRLSPEGKKFIIDVLEPGTVFGEMSVIGQGMQNTFAEAVEPCVLCVMSRPDVEMLLHLEQPGEFAVIHWLDTKANEAYRRHPVLRTAHPRVRGLPDLRIGPEGRATDWYEVLS